MRKRCILPILCIIFTGISSCYTVKFTHQEVMDLANLAMQRATKNDVLSAFGIPTHKKSEGRYSEWVYDYGTNYLTLSNPTTTDITVNTNPLVLAPNIQARTYGGNSYNIAFQHYIRITFYDNEVRGLESVGMDYTVKEKDQEKTIIAIVLTILGSLLTVVLLAAAV